MTQARVHAWERKTEPALMVLAVGFLVAYAVPILEPDLSDGAVALAELTQWLVWAVFAFDYMVRLTLASDRRRFVKHNLLDLVAVLLPMLRPLRLLRMIGTILLVSERAQRSTRYKVTTYVCGTAVLVALLAALAVLDAERGQPGATITTPADAFWWSAATVTTVGYGDTYPVTGVGRMIAVLLMITGIALLGVITANVAAWFVERFNETSEQAKGEQDRLDHIVHLLEDLRMTTTSTHDQTGPLRACGHCPKITAEKL
ncbi:potassium channel family protein [Phytoactinopolyspora limicola]|uniref:potassium channel family protein n=1 Tax=Phytoactinopolyspora limicola TaxID=2715536 RepID=UPI001A9C365D|nr:potassium channel family protein [Phytoactinopolyspora limicola]